MTRHNIEKSAPIKYRVPENIPNAPKFRTIVADPKNQTSGSKGSYGGAINHYPLMDIRRI